MQINQAENPLIRQFRRFIRKTNQSKTAIGKGNWTFLRRSFRINTVGRSRTRFGFSFHNRYSCERATKRKKESSYDAQKRKTQHDFRRSRHRRDRVAAGAVRESQEHGLLRGLLPARHGGRAGPSLGGGCAVHPARDHRSGLRQLFHGTCQEGIFSARRQRARDPLCARYVRDDRKPDVPRLPVPHDPQTRGRRPQRASGFGRLCLRHFGRRVLPQ